MDWIDFGRRGKRVAVYYRSMLAVLQPLDGNGPSPLPKPGLGWGIFH